MKYGACSHTGNIRDTNQDSYFINENDNFPVFVVADGMGGHNGGEIASRITVDVIKNNTDIYYEKLIKGKLPIPGFIRKTLELCNEEIYNASNENKIYKGMGTTVTMGCIFEGKLYIGHIGDSRAYIFRDNDIRQITKDHSLVAQLVNNGTITEEEAVNHPQRNIITRALGTDADVKIDIYDYDLFKDDIILLCTDGLTNMVNETEILHAINDSEDVQSICDTLINHANDNGGHDNSTVLIIKIDK